MAKVKEKTWDSPKVANIYMKEFENEAINIDENPPRFWKRCVDDTLVIRDMQQNDNFLQDIDSIGKAIQFTVEDIRPDGAMPFLNMLITPTPDKTISTLV